MPHEETRRVVHILQGKRKKKVYAPTKGRAHASHSPDTVKGEVYATTKGRAHTSRSPDKLKLVFFGRGF